MTPVTPMVYTHPSLQENPAAVCLYTEKTTPQASDSDSEWAWQHIARLRQKCHAQRSSDANAANETAQRSCATGYWECTAKPD